MGTIFTPKGIRLIANLLITLIALMGAVQVVDKVATLLTSPDEINVVKLDVPWVHPGDNVAILLDQQALVEDPDFHHQLQINVFIYDLAERVVYISLLVLILILLKKLVLSIRSRAFLDQRHMTIINQLALVVGTYVISKFLFYQLVPIFIPVDLMVETVNFTTLGESVFETIMAATDFKMLFVGICLYVISVSFREGYELKKESELTI
ncbi:DUF2975 domain-containing protein [candidate division GN15 bacterium]|nr:DUF2975 domain-containing protein [candidate division GN15 bacterium]